MLSGGKLFKKHRPEMSSIGFAQKMHLRFGVYGEANKVFLGARLVLILAVFLKTRKLVLLSYKNFFQKVFLKILELCSLNF